MKANFRKTFNKREQNDKQCEQNTVAAWFKIQFSAN